MGGVSGMFVLMMMGGGVRGVVDGFGYDVALTS